MHPCRTWSTLAGCQIWGNVCSENLWITPSNRSQRTYAVERNRGRGNLCISGYAVVIKYRLLSRLTTSGAVIQKLSLASSARFCCLEWTNPPPHPANNVAVASRVRSRFATTPAQKLSANTLALHQIVWPVHEIFNTTGFSLDTPRMNTVYYQFQLYESGGNWSWDVLHLVDTCHFNKNIECMDQHIICWILFKFNRFFPLSTNHKIIQKSDETFPGKWVESRRLICYSSRSYITSLRIHSCGEY